MTNGKDFCEKEIERISKIAKKSDLIYACIIYYSPITNDYDSRVAFFEHNYESILWINATVKFYVEHNIAHTVYTNN